MLTENGFLFWIMGLSGSGKSEIAKIVVSNLRARNLPLIWLDGDDMRQKLNLVGHDPSDRVVIGKVYLGFSQILVEQGFSVVLSSIGMNRTLEGVARKSFRNYSQIHIDASLDFIKDLNLRKIYHDETVNVMGKDIIPDSLIYDLVIKNNSSISLGDISKSVEKYISSKLN